MGFGAELLHQARAKGFDFSVRKRGGLAVETDKPRDPRNLQDFQAIAQRQTHKHVTRKQRQLQLHAPVLPAPHAVIEWQKVLDGPFEELLRYTLFVVGAGVCNIPVRLRKRHLQVRRLSVVSFRNAFHNHLGSPRNRRIQLRPVSHRAEIDITNLDTKTYSYLARVSADFSASSWGIAFPKFSSVPECCFHPFFDAQGRYALEA